MDKPAVYNPGHIKDPETSAPFSLQIPQMDMVHIREWPHGHVKVDWAFSERAIRYVVKYLLSDDKDNAWFSLSKKPPLGAAFFAAKARQARELGVIPSSFNYLPPGGDREKPYMMSGATRRDYLNAITQDEADRPKMSEWVLKTYDKHARARLIQELETVPFDEQNARFARWAEDREDRDASMRLARAYRHEREIAIMLEQHPAWRREGGKWVPYMGGKDGEQAQAEEGPGARVDRNWSRFIAAYRAGAVAQHDARGSRQSAVGDGASRHDPPADGASDQDGPSSQGGS